MKFLTAKLAKILLFIFILVLSFTVLTQTVPEMEYMEQTVDFIEESQNTLMTFSGTTTATSLAISALPDDFASPLAGTISDLNTYFIFMFAVLFVEKLIVMEGTKISLAYIIPAACILYIIGILSKKSIFKKFSVKLFILGCSLVMVIPISTHFTEVVCADYLVYVEETITETNDGATKINEIITSNEEDASLFDKLSDAFKTSIQGISDLLAYFENVLKKCINSVSIMLVTTFILPLLILMLFKWLLKELFSLHIPIPEFKNKLQEKKSETTETKLLPMEDEE
ncbi:MAG: hypothetical protein IJ274_12440 [Lachnospiraceae bacterium]|nr:hypothetical protein [Lachnospiraceae bacterium]